MKPALTVLVLGIVWAAITGSFSGLNLLFGIVIGIVVVLLLRRDAATKKELRRARNIWSLLLMFLYELMASAVKVAIVVLTPNIKAAVRPAVVAVPLTVKSDAEIALLANLITLTPGTLSLDVSEDRSALYVHALSIDTPEALIADISGGFEAKVKEVFQ
jgi:multicomponent Na+:H+ antiporter subunit E